MHSRPVFRFVALLAYLTLSATSQAQLVINEVDADDDGFDNLEFVELFDGGAGNTSLDGHSLVFFNGNGDSSYLAIDLSGFSTNPDGFFLVANPDVAGVYDTTVDITVDPGSTGAFQNGADAVALVATTADQIADRTPVDDPIISNNLVDALVYGTGDPDDFEFLDALLLPNQNQIDENANGEQRTECSARVPDGGTQRSTDSYVTQTPTPGISNVVSNELTVSLSPKVLPENGAAESLTITLSRTGPTTSDLEVTLTPTNPDGTIDRSELDIPLSVTIPAGQADLVIDAGPRDDHWQDGPQDITVTATGFGYLDGTDDITVQDTGNDTLKLVINEFYANVLADANGDDDVTEEDRFSVTNPDEFIEFVNVSDEVLNLSGWTITDLWVDTQPDTRTPNHTFPPDTLVTPGCAIVVFSGGVTPEGPNPSFGNAIVQNAANGFGLSLHQSDRISVQNELGEEMTTLEYFDEDGFDGSSTLITDADPASGYEFHFIASPAPGTEFSPGTKIDGSPFCVEDQSLTIEIAAASVIENASDAGEAATTATISRSEPTTGALEVSLSSNDTSEITVQDTATIPDGAPSVTVNLNAQNDFTPDGTKTVTITATADGFDPAQATIDVTDDGDEAPPFVINELDADQDGTDNAEFIEIYDGGIGNSSLDDFVIVLYNGNGELSYFAIALDGESTDADGYFVLGDPDVPNVDLVTNFGNTGLQNGADAVALYVGANASEFTDTSPISFPAAATLIDAVVYGTNDTLDENSLLLTELTSDNIVNNEGPSNNSNSLGRSPDGTGNFVQFANPSPGEPNGSVTASAFATWASNNGIAGAPKDGDSDGDLIPNAIEFALGLNPNSPDDHPLSSLEPSGSDFTITFSKGADAAADPSASYEIQISDNLSSWTPLAPTTNDNATISATVSGNSPAKYVRLVFTCTP